MLLSLRLWKASINYLYALQLLIFEFKLSMFGSKECNGCNQQDGQY